MFSSSRSSFSVEFFVFHVAKFLDSLVIIEELKSSDQQTVLGSWPSGRETLYYEPGSL